MGFPHIAEDPASVNETSLSALLGQVYFFPGSDASTAPRGLYRYVQVKDIAMADGKAACPDASATGNDIVTIDRSEDLFSTHCSGVGVGAITADSYGYILVQGFHTNLLGDGSVAAGEALMVGAGDGVIDTHTGAVPMIGVAFTADDSSSRFEGMINCPIG